jgi:hypothetical protein
MIEPTSGVEDIRLEQAIVCLSKQLAELAKFDRFVAHREGSSVPPSMRHQVQREGERLQRWKERTVAALQAVLNSGEVSRFSRIQVSAVQYPSPTVLRNNLSEFTRYLSSLREESKEHSRDFLRVRARALEPSLPVIAERVPQAKPIAVIRSDEIPPLKPEPLPVPERVTFGWLWHHVEWKVWVVAVAALAITFLVGVAVGKGKGIADVLEMLTGR